MENKSQSTAMQDMQNYYIVALQHANVNHTKVIDLRAKKTQFKIEIIRTKNYL